MLCTAATTQQPWLHVVSTQLPWTHTHTPSNRSLTQLLPSLLFCLASCHLPPLLPSSPHLLIHSHSTVSPFEPPYGGSNVGGGPGNSGPGDKKGNAPGPKGRLLLINPKFDVVTSTSTPSGKILSNERGKASARLNQPSLTHCVSLLPPLLSFVCTSRRPMPPPHTPPKTSTGQTKQLGRHLLKITPVKENGGGKTPNGQANGVPTVNKNPAGAFPPGQNP